MLARLLVCVLLSVVPSVAFAQDSNEESAAYPSNLQTLAQLYGPTRIVRPPDVKETTDLASGNFYRTKRNPDGTTDVFGFNPNTGSSWSQHIDPANNLQWGRNKNGELWRAPLNLSTPHTSVQDFPWGQDPSNQLNAAPNPYGFSLPRELYRANDMASVRRLLGLKGVEHQQGNLEKEALQGDYNIAPEREAAVNPSNYGLGAFGPEPSALDMMRENQIREYQALQSMLGVVSAMEPGSLATASRAAALQQCSALTDENARAACVKEVDKK